MKDKYDALKLENQLCFPLYACSKEIVRRYKPYLDEIDLTYTCLLYTSPSPRDGLLSRMPSSA